MWWLIAVAVVLWLMWPKKAGKKDQPPGQSHAPDAPKKREKRKEDFWSSPDVRRVPANLQIKYEDAQGDLTERVIHLRFVAPHDDTLMLRAHCDMRDDVRSFRADRVIEATDLDTGEVIDDFESWLREKSGMAADFEGEDEEMPVIWRVARVLRCVGSADGQFRKDERRIASENLSGISGAGSISLEDADLLLSQGGRPTRDDLVESLDVLVDFPDVLIRLLPVAEQMVATQKVVHPDEASALAEIRARIGQPSLAAGSGA